MTRQKMLEVLSDLPFALIWPGSWDDIGFTEREIWVNNKGYGYIMCDEPTDHWEGQGLTVPEWDTIKAKIENESLCYSDIKDTSVEELLFSLGYNKRDFQDDENESLSELLRGLLLLQNGPCGYLSALQTFDGPLYFDSQSAFREAFERDWVDEKWDEMDEDLLSEWINRLCIEDDGALVEWTLKHGLL